jgi:hypothetical protein
LENIKNVYIQIASKTGSISYSYLQTQSTISKFENITGNITVYKTGEIAYEGWVGEYISKCHNKDNYFIRFKKALIGIDNSFIYLEGYRDANGIFCQDRLFKNKIIFEA